MVSNRIQSLITDGLQVGSNAAVNTNTEAHHYLALADADPDVVGYTYDDMGNRLTMSQGGATTDYEYDAADQLVEVEAVANDFDENGNQTERGSDTFAWDHENRLMDSDIDSVESSYNYNGDGLRVRRTVGASGIDYFWDVGSSLPVVLQNDDDYTYVYGLGLISRTNGGGDQEYHLADGLGSTTGLTDGTGAVADEYDYDVFGAVRRHAGGSANEFTFTGEQNDPTGLEFLRARYYDPEVGRFLRRDPIPYLQRYAYANNNPANLTDPTGLSSVADLTTAVWECVTYWGGKMMDIHMGNPCAAELDAMFAAMEAGWNGFDKGANSIPGEGSGNPYAKDFYGVLASMGYLDFNFTACRAGACWTFGGQFSFGEGFHRYYGAGVGPNQFGFSLTFAPAQHIEEGIVCGTQVGIGGPDGIGGAVQWGGVGLEDPQVTGGNPGDNWFAEGGVSFGLPTVNPSWSSVCINVTR